jgi:2-polyprenyl-3-methyl-5-hydroxy-6-metoxy-1,4-benzoquinol methylase
MQAKATTARLVEHYNTYTRRPTVADPRTRAFVHGSFRRVLAGWLPSDRNARLIDVGCGEGALLSFLVAAGYDNIAAFDLSPENVAICHRQGFGFVKLDNALNLLSFAGEEKFDVAFAMDLLEHIPKESAAEFLEQARLVLKPGGSLIIQTPNMGCVFGVHHRYNDLSHEFGLTEKTARDLLMVAGFAASQIEIRPAWHATTRLGYLREVYLRLLHSAVYLAEDASRPRVPTKNLLIRARA